jgi:hypothetical protein
VPIFDHNGPACGGNGGRMTDLVVCRLPRGRALVLSTLDGVAWLPHRAAPVPLAAALREADLRRAQDPALRVHQHDGNPADPIPAHLRRPDTRIV